MKAMLERNTDEQTAETLPEPTVTSRNHSHSKDRGSWTRISATAGAAAWMLIAILARSRTVPVGQIELLFLFAPLVIVPLGLELGRTIAGQQCLIEVAKRLQPVGAALAVLAFLLPLGEKAALAASGWMVVCLLIAASSIVNLLRGSGEGQTRTVAIVLSLARIDLVVGGAWLVASRWGMKPMGIQEPIGLLTAVHFHFAGFATSTIAAASLKSGRTRQRWFQVLALAIAALPYIVATGFVISPLLKMIAAVLFSLSMAALAVTLRSDGTRAQERTARVLLQIAAGAIFAGMMLSGAYAMADFVGSDSLTIPQMARTHGILNAVGFCLCGLLGWLIESEPSGKIERDSE